MRLFISTIVLFCWSCSDRKETASHPATTTQTTSFEEQVAPTPPQVKNEEQTKRYQNARFKNVTVKKIAPDTYKLTGEGQIFEASFNWVVEDGHNELKSGYATTDAGAPEWGKFDFTVTVAKERENSVLHLILFEASAKDGRRTHELPVLLP